MTPAELLRIFPFAASKVLEYAPLLTATMTEFDIDTPRRQAAFLAQVGHESAQLRYTAEIADGSAYEGRTDLGNDQPGDGKRYKGRGLIQVTGRANYVAAGTALARDLVRDPGLLEGPALACRSAGWFWRTHSLNQFADVDQFGTLTKRINGGYNHIDERIQLWLAARKVMNL